MAVNFIRTIIIFFFITGVFRIMGKRQIGELQASELVVAILISEIASVPIQDSSNSLLFSLMAITILLACEVGLSLACQKSPRIRKFVYGSPSVLIERGKINQKEMRRQRINISDLMENIRNSGIATIDEVEYLIVETNGKISAIQKAAKSPMTLEDLSLTADEKEISYIIIDDGKIFGHNIRLLGFDRNWLRKHLIEHKVKNPKDVYYMSATRGGEVFLYPKEES